MYSMIIYQLSHQLQYPAEASGAKEAAPTRTMAEDNLNIICNFGLLFKEGGEVLWIECVVCFV